MNIKGLPDLAHKLLNGDRASLAKAITLLESSHQDHWKLSKELLKLLKSHGKKSFRLGVTGPPGVGKSTFIEALGQRIVQNGQRVAVLAIDPSSQISGGSILGDKTRMEELSRSDLAFIRPSPSRGFLGGVTASMPGTLFLCEAAGYDWIIVETVGVGQSEVEVKNMVDHFIFLAQPGSGDELQGVKKGILEFVDTILINKADLDNQLANVSQQQHIAALKVMRGMDIPVFSCSSLGGKGLGEISDHLIEKSRVASPRSQQNLYWFQSLLRNQLIDYLNSRDDLKKLLQAKERKVEKDKVLPTEAMDEFFDEIFNRKK